MDIIFLRELKIDTLIGVYEWEKRVPQTLQIDLEIALPSSLACQTDNIDDALNYADVVRDALDGAGLPGAELVKRAGDAATAGTLRGVDLAATHAALVDGSG